MATGFRSGTFGLIQHLFDEGTCTGLSDARLLERFVSHRDEAAFATLVARHGAMVLRTCQGVLNDPNAADDAFQTTFVLLFRKAASIRASNALGCWLHRVAYRAALQARSDVAAGETSSRPPVGPRVAETTFLVNDLQSVLHEEIELAAGAQLPSGPVVLCDLEGNTRDQAADLLRL